MTRNQPHERWTVYVSKGEYCLYINITHWPWRPDFAHYFPVFLMVIIKAASFVTSLVELWVHLSPPGPLLCSAPHPKCWISPSVHPRQEKLKSFSTMLCSFKTLLKLVMLSFPNHVSHIWISAASARARFQVIIHLLSGAFRTPSLLAFLLPTHFQDIRPLAPAVSIALPLLSAVGSKSDVSIHDRDDTASAFDASGLKHTN